MKKNVVGKGITAKGNVTIGDVTHIHPVEPKLPKELTLNLPKIHPDDIIGRADDLADLHRLLSESKRVVLINGLGGIGKTTLAQAYVSQYYDNYHHIAWVTQASESMTSDLVNTPGLVENLSVTVVSGDSDKIGEEILRKLKNLPDKPNLLVIDNAEQSLKRYRDWLPSQPLWHLLVTSRESLSDHFFHKTLDFLTAEQAVALFRKHYTHRKITDEDIRALVTEVDYHTLTIEILAKTAQVQRYDAATLKQAIEKDLRANIDVAHNRQASKVEKVRSYLRTVFGLSKLSEAESWLMKNLFCLPPEFHSYDLLRELIVAEGSAWADVFPETLSELVRKGWLLPNEATETYKMHRIMAEVMQDELQIDIADVQQLLESVSQKLKIDQTKDNPVEKFVWIPFGKVLVSFFLDRSDSEIALLQNNLALVLKDLGDYEGARLLMAKAVVSDEKNFGLDHQTTAVSYSNLALVLKDLGDYESACSLLAKAVVSNEKTFGLDHPTTARSYSNLAVVLQDLGDYEGACSLLAKAVVSNEKAFGLDHPTTARSYSNLAVVLKALGDYEGARTLLAKAVVSNEKTFGLDHPTTARSYSNLALVLKDLGDYEGARTLLAKAVVSNDLRRPSGWTIRRRLGVIRIWR